ncbi:MAG: hypothetical protein J7463_12205 [Roseiflexus sp.]|nr:hypothetical protein [Roseiflexus sp.]MBO9334354.1 hypothetical protein [Roseiflexus sp.]MBO9340879.1 hypothetical protein [Roseiflexus sp.]MBO9365419.1 hypothetical protein [Roseiflexus sp.]MBO9383329.1 hypothetical protein [Roseiflexus sp.]
MATAAGQCATTGSWRLTPQGIPLWTDTGHTAQHVWPTNSMQWTALRAAADAARLSAR